METSDDNSTCNVGLCCAENNISSAHSNILRYRPPEQVSGKCVRATDVYSMGATLLFAASGQHPFPQIAASDVSLMFSYGSSLFHA